MQIPVPFSPDQASSYAGEVDALYGFLWVLTFFFGIGLTLAIFYFAIKYRRRHPDEVGHPVAGAMGLELLWTVIPFLISMGIFAWGAELYFKIYRPPATAMDVYVVGKQWMWKFQHTEGQREINELHVPLGRRVKLIMTTEDVIHSFFVPAFRMKLDIVPGRYSTVWFEPTQLGRFELFCAEYCGTSHSGMIGSVVVMDPAEYQAWLAGGSGEGTPAQQGEKLFAQLACNSCHLATGQGRGPRLQGVFGSQVELADGSKITANEDYIRESILNPRARIVAGFQPIMPTFQGLVSEEQVLQLVAYVHSLTQEGQGGAAGGATGSATGSAPASAGGANNNAAGGRAVGTPASQGNKNAGSAPSPRP
ncbi:MAG: cytochrome c oxidase subunit [Blastocatellia bacterium]